MRGLLALARRHKLGFGPATSMRPMTSSIPPNTPENAAPSPVAPSSAASRTAADWPLETPLGSTVGRASTGDEASGDPSASSLGVGMGERMDMSTLAMMGGPANNSAQDVAVKVAAVASGAAAAAAAAAQAAARVAQVISGGGGISDPSAAAVDAAALAAHQHAAGSMPAGRAPDRAEPSMMGNNSGGFGAAIGAVTPGFGAPPGGTHPVCTAESSPPGCRPPGADRPSVGPARPARQYVDKVDPVPPSEVQAANDDRGAYGMNAGDGEGDDAQVIVPNRSDSGYLAGS